MHVSKPKARGTTPPRDQADWTTVVPGSVSHTTEPMREQEAVSNVNPDNNNTAQLSTFVSMQARKDVIGNLMGSRPGEC
ncbi:hypothetical protein PBY51_008220 [Eleginops maclovinus]|uniref:Uncharacterized protein n=1 Tax=Eleginops maclovinus TaxID=56733 RepID=A0AAN7X7W0_ELEMC|nr:hypothetical protein PBY51_008220 [Eleginops maclovinus]